MSYYFAAAAADRDLRSRQNGRDCRGHKMFISDRFGHLKISIDPTSSSDSHHHIILYQYNNNRRRRQHIFSVPPAKIMSGNKIFAGITALLMVAVCSAQTVQPAPVQIVSSSPPTLLPPPSPYFNGFRPNGAYPQQYIGGPQQQFNGVLPPQFIGGPNVAQRFYNNGQNPAYNGQFVPILQQSFDISPEGSYTFG